MIVMMMLHRDIVQRIAPYGVVTVIGILHLAAQK